MRKLCTQQWLNELIQAISFWLKGELGKPVPFPHICLFSAAEILAKTVRNNKGITGFSLGNDEVKISQHADDTTFVLDGSEKSLISAVQSLDDFCKISGLKLNDSKTEALLIGSKTAHEQILVSG